MFRRFAIVLFSAFAVIAGSKESRAQIVFGTTAQTPCGSARKVASGDFDGDGTRDVAILRLSAPTFTLLRNSGGGAFATPTLFSLGIVSMNGIVAADFDGDGDLDVAGNGTNSSGGSPYAEIGVALNHGDGTFAAPVSSPLPGQIYGYSLVAANLNPGSAIDLVLCEPSSNWNLVQVMINNGNGTFVPGPSITLPNVYNVQAADLDGDADNDLVIAQQGISPVFRVYKNNGQGFFSFFGLTSGGTAGEGPHGMVCADVDGDGDVDVVGDRFPAAPGFPGTGGSVIVLRNNGSGVLAAPVTTPAGGYVTGVALADFDGDGARDAVVADAFLAGVHILRNTGSGSFVPALFRPSGIVDHHAEDFDGDGDPDIIAVADYELSFLQNLDPMAAFGPYPGTAEDLHLLTGVNATPTTGPGLTIKSARAGDHLGMRLTSSGGSFIGDPFMIAGELFPTGSPPGSLPGFPMIHLGGPGVFILVSNSAGPFTLGVPAGGFHLPLIVPPGLAGQSAMLQAVAFSTAAANALFAATDAHEIRFVP